MFARLAKRASSRAGISRLHVTGGVMGATALGLGWTVTAFAEGKNDLQSSAPTNEQSKLTSLVDPLLQRKQQPSTWSIFDPSQGATFSERVGRKLEEYQRVAPPEGTPFTEDPMKWFNEFFYNRAEDVVLFTASLLPSYSQKRMDMLDASRKRSVRPDIRLNDYYQTWFGMKGDDGRKLTAGDIPIYPYTDYMQVRYVFYLHDCFSPHRVVLFLASVPSMDLFIHYADYIYIYYLISCISYFLYSQAIPRPLVYFDVRIDDGKPERTLTPPVSPPSPNGVIFIV